MFRNGTLLIVGNNEGKEEGLERPCVRCDKVPRKCRTLSNSHCLAADKEKSHNFQSLLV